MTDSAFSDIIEDAEARIGTTLKGKWHIDRLIGTGGMASVFAATHRNNKRVAIKMLHPSLSILRSVRDRFLREGYVANSVGHSGAVSVDDDDVTDDGCAFLVMELLEGDTLEARRVRAGGRLATEEVLSSMDQVLGTLAAAHAKGIVHRDLKPENLFLTSSGETKVLDFGIAKLRELGLSTSRTHTGSLMGTPAFMPPEQALGRWDEVDAQSDLWAIGATMFNLLTGEYVHRGSTVNELLIFAATRRAPSLAEQMPGANPFVIQLVNGALALEKSERWSDANAMRRVVRKCLVLLDDPAIDPVQLNAAEQSQFAATAEAPRRDDRGEATDGGEPPSPAQAESAVVSEHPAPLTGIADGSIGPSDAHPEEAFPENETTTSTAGLEQNSTRQRPKSKLRLLAIGTLFGAVILGAVVHREGRQAGAPRPQPAAAPEPRLRALEVRLPTPSSVPVARSVETLPTLASTPPTPSGTGGHERFLNVVGGTAERSSTRLEAIS